MNLSQTALVFPGQGSQSAGMLVDYFNNHKTFSDTFENAKEITGIDFKSLIFLGNSEDLSKTEITQPLMLTANVALWNTLEIKSSSLGAMAGHSLGEFAALVAGDVLLFEDAIRLVSIRAKLMQKAVPQNEGGIAAIIGLEESKIKIICEEVTALEEELVNLANINSPVQIVISGTKKGVEIAIDRCKEAGAKRAMLLAMSVPAHCSLMSEAASKFAKHLDSVNFCNPSLKIFQNYNASFSEDLEVVKQNLINLVNDVEIISLDNYSSYLEKFNNLK
jgi:[acyl-carrier-protein] S-malonyltransferase